jgi:D-alanyl-lipoteichoic acid acyltransferase DltB (MBOAT superfamily)
MIFNSLEYILFLILIVLVYWQLRGVRLQNLLLLGASYFFYANWNWRFLSLIVISTMVDYLVGRLLEYTEGPLYRNLLLLLSLSVNLGMLGFFKYYNFFVQSFTDLLTIVGIHANLETLNIILPVGISFYTFQTLSYTIDIYRKQLEPTRNFIDFALFVSFFPQLVAGPIERAKRLIPQITEPRSISPEQVESGLILILIGLLKKIVIADIAASMINPLAFSEPHSIASGLVLQAVYLFAIQIYADFSAYSDIARGSARLLGFELMENFNQPYFAQTISEFWRRWHISLSTWLRDYLYIPLNNLSRGLISHELSIYSISVMGTMLLSGLWHGANYTYVMWGGLLGVYQVLQHPFKGRAKGLLNHPNQWIRYATISFRILLTFHLVLFAWVFFRTPSVRHIPDIYQSMFEAVFWDTGSNPWELILPTLLVYGLSFFIDIGQIALGEHAFPIQLHRPYRILLYICIILLIVYMTVKPYVPFIYFQF